MYSKVISNYKMPPYSTTNDNRFAGGFLAPFLLGGITGGLLAPSFYPRPIYGPVIYRPYPVPYYPNQYFYTNNQF